MNRISFWHQNHDTSVFTLDRGRQRKSLFFLTMDDKHFLRRRSDRPDIVQQLIPISVCGKSIEAHDLCSPGCRDAKNGDNIPSFNQSATERMFRLKADDGDDIGFVLDCVFEVVQNTTAFAHPRGGNDDTWAFHGVEALTVID